MQREGYGPAASGFAGVGPSFGWPLAAVVGRRRGATSAAEEASHGSKHARTGAGRRTTGQAGVGVGLVRT